MAKTADRKVEIAKRIRDIACDDHGLDPEALIFDALTFTLTTGDEEWRPSAVETIDGIRRIKAELPGREDLAGRLERVASACRRTPARCSTRSSSTTAWRRGSTWRWSTRTTSRPTGRSRRTSASSPTTSSSTAARTRSSASSRHFEQKGETEEEAGGRPDRGHGARGGAPLAHPAPQEGGRGGLDRPVGREDRRRADAQPGAAARHEGGGRQVRRRRADPAVRAPVGRGDEARRGAARELPRPDRGPHQGQGRDRDRVRRRARHRQVARQHDPHQQRLHRDRPRQAGAGGHDHQRRDRERGRRDRPLGPARVHLQADADLRPGAAPARARVPGADRRRRDQPRLRPPHPLPEGQGVGRGLRARGLLLQGRLPGPRHDGRPGRGGAARARWSTKMRDEARKLREKVEVVDDAPPVDRRLGALGVRAPTCPCPSRRSGARARCRWTSTRSTRTSTATCSSSCTGAGAARRARSGGRSWRATTARRASRPGSSACGASRTTCTRARKLGYFPCAADGNELVVFDPDDPERELERLRFPRQPQPRPHLPGRLLPPARLGRARRGGAPGRDRRRRGHRADGPPREGRRVRRAALHPRPRRADRRGDGRVAARRGAPRARHRPRPGPPLLVGLPRLPGPVRAREGLAPAGPRGDRDVRSPTATP